MVFLPSDLPRKVGVTSKSEWKVVPNDPCPDVGGILVCLWVFGEVFEVGDDIFVCQVVGVIHFWGKKRCIDEWSLYL